MACLIAQKRQWWPNGIIPYSFHDSVTAQVTAAARSAMQAWQDSTRIRFVEKRPEHKNSIQFNSHNSGTFCQSPIGRLWTDETQNVACSIADVPLIIHELGHAIGFGHEQFRTDRDRYIQILTGNIAQPNQFTAPPGSFIDFGTYDHRSIMHYREFSNVPIAIDPNQPVLASIMPGIASSELGANRTIGPGEIAAVAHLVPYYRVTITQIRCSMQQDSTGDDDVEIKVAVDGGGYKKAWRKKMDQGDTRTVDHTVQFTSQLKIKIIEHDWLDPDDTLGKITLTDGRSGAENIYGGRYRISWRADLSYSYEAGA